jgi:hypothetical protein
MRNTVTITATEFILRKNFENVEFDIPKLKWFTRDLSLEQHAVEYILE